MSTASAVRLSVAPPTRCGGWVAGELGAAADVRGEGGPTAGSAD